MSRQAAKSKPSDWCRRTGKRKRNPLFLYIPICRSLLGLQHCLCACLQSTSDTVSSMQTVNIKPRSASLLFYRASVYSLPRKTFPQVPLVNFSKFWSCTGRYKSSSAARWPLLGSGAGVQCSKRHHCCSAGKQPHWRCQYSALFLSYCAVVFLNAVCQPYKSIPMAWERPVELQKDETEGIL